MARVGLAALGLLVGLGLAEGVLRVAAVLDSEVRFLATGRASRPVATYPTLETFLAAQTAYITPHGVWYNHFSNAFGFHDEEFVEPKPRGRLRVLAVGDSFTFAPVPYPQGVMTLTEAGLRAACGGRDLEVLNLGLMGAGVPEYRILVELGVARFAPDLVLLNLFLGNDPPDLHRYVHDRSPLERALRRSYAWTFGKNFVRARGGLRDGRLPARVQAPAPETATPRGGAVVNPARALAPDDPALVGPVLSEKAYTDALGFDLGRLYRPANDRDLHAAWQPLLAELDALRAAARRGGVPVALALLPSVLQVDAALRDAIIARISTAWRYRGLSPADIDPRLPSVLLAGYARARGLPHVDLTAAFARENGGEAAEPLYKQRDNHWTPRGNRLAAEGLVDFVAPLVCAR
jgi:SGNH hydrolase-like domain, acetyltransferase AlgX